MCRGGWGYDVVKETKETNRLLASVTELKGMLKYRTLWSSWFQGVKNTKLEIPEVYQPELFCNQLF